MRSRTWSCHRIWPKPSAAGAASAFESLTAGRRKQLLYWIKSAKREPTRTDRIAKTVAAAREGRSALD